MNPLAAAIAGSYGKEGAVSVSIGSSNAFNQVDNQIKAYIENADQGVTATGGDVTLAALSQGADPIDLDLVAHGLNFADLDNASVQDEDDPNDPLNDSDDVDDPTDDAVDEAAVDVDGDAAILDKLKDAFADIGIELVVDESVSGDANYTTFSAIYSEHDLVTGDTVGLTEVYHEGGATGDVRVITYCGGGIAASSDAFVLTMLGAEDVAVYDASLSEWAADSSLPMELG